MNGAGDFANHHLSVLDDENLHWNLACNNVILIHGGRASPRNGIFANVAVYQDLPQKF